MLKKKTKIHKQEVIQLNLDNTCDFLKLNRDGGKLKDGTTTTVDAPPMCTFTENKGHFWRRPRKIVLYVQGTTKALKFKAVNVDDKTKLEMDDMNPYWTQKEAREFVAKEVAEARKKHKPMTWGQFILLAIPVVVILVLVLKVALQVGAV